MSWWSAVVDFFSGDAFVDAAVGAAAGAVTAKMTGGSALKGALVGGALNYASGAGYLGDTAQGFTRGVGDGVAGLFTGGSGGPGASPQGSYSGWDSSGGGSVSAGLNYAPAISGDSAGFGDGSGMYGGEGGSSYYGDDAKGIARARAEAGDYTTQISSGPSSVGLAGSPSGSSTPSGSFQDRLKAGLSNPGILLKGGLALGAALTGSGGMDNQNAAWNTYTAQQGAADAENKATRDRQNNTANTIEVSGGPDAMKTAMVRGANQVESLQSRLGYTSSPTAVKAALVGKAQQQAGLNAQTAYASGDANARTTAANIRQYAPQASMAGLQYAGRQDAFQTDQNNNMWKNIGGLADDIFGYGQERKTAQADAEYKRRKALGMAEGPTP